MILAQPHKAAEIAAFLALNPERAMFPLSKPLVHGLRGNRPDGTRSHILFSAPQAVP